MDILQYPDPRLRAPNAPIVEFTPELAKISAAMFEAMYRTDGVGLAGPQVGINLKLLVFNPGGDSASSETEVVLCNPKIVSRSRETESGEEGCLSFPEINAQVVRPITSIVEAQDIEGNGITLELEGWASRIFQHEYDHLEGVLLVDRMSPADKVRNKHVLQDLVARYQDRRKREESPA